MKKHDESTLPACEGDCGCHRSSATRREFLAAASAGAAGLFLGSRPVVAGPFRREDRYREAVPADKKLDPAWVRSLYQRGEKTVYRAPEALRHIGMPVGGLFAGTVYLGGDGRLWLWDIFNRDQEGIEPRTIERPLPHGGGGPLVKVMARGGLNYLEPAPPKSPFGQEFWIEAGEGGRRSLDLEGFSKVSFDGRYPIGRVSYADPGCPLEVRLEAFSPFVPLRLEDSSLPATVMSFTVRNRSTEPVEATLGGFLENPVCLESAAGVRGRRVNRVLRGGGMTSIEASAAPPAAPDEPPRPDIALDDFERADYSGWTAEGEAFGEGPVRVEEIPAYQGDVNGHGERVVNSHASAPGADVREKDSRVGKLTSDEFEIRRHFIRLRVGGGGHRDQTCVRLLVGGKKVASVCGKNDNRMSVAGFDVRRFEGRKARLQIVDEVRGSWGNIGVDEIVQTDRSPQGGSLESRRDFGTMSLALLDGDRGSVIATAQRGSPEPLERAEGPLDGELAGEIQKRLSLAPGESRTADWVIAWHFPRLHIRALAGANLRHWYAARFASSGEVARYVAESFERLAGDTREWVETWYDSSLPYWLLDRTMANTSTLATTTCYRMADGRFWAWEGIGCCFGTCTHVWHYAQAPGRIFPELERDQRRRVDFGLAQHPDGGIGHRSDLRGSREPAIDGHAGRILGLYREHRMSPDGEFLRSLWPHARKAVEWLLARDGNDDGVIEGAQANTLDAAWYGKISWITSLYLAALRAGEAMAREVGDVEFAERCRTVAERGARGILETYNGEYFTQIEDPRHADAIGTGKGCHIDQIFGQTWAHWVGLGRLFEREKQLSALRALYKYNFVPDIGPFREKFPRGRWYAVAGDSGLVMCTWPRGGESSQYSKHWQYGYFNECMTGFEWQAAAHMVWEGLDQPDLLEHGLAVGRAVHDRYDAALRNPYNEIECSDHYARAMASFGVYQAACGLHCHGPRGELAFAPRLGKRSFKAAFVAPEGWGSYEQRLEAGGAFRVRLALKRGSLRLRRLSLASPDPSFRAGKARAGDIELELRARDDGGLDLDFEEEKRLERGQSLEIRIERA